MFLLVTKNMRNSKLEYNNPRQQRSLRSLDLLTSAAAGGVESRELLTQAIVREVFEETSLEVDVPEEIFAVVNRGRKEHFFLVNVPFFEPKLSPQSPEFKAQNCSNRYELTWIKLNDLSQLNLVPVEAKLIVISLVQEARI